MFKFSSNFTSNFLPGYEVPNSYTSSTYFSFCDLKLDFAYFVEEYKQLDARETSVITAGVIAVSIVLITSSFMLDFWPRYQRTVRLFYFS